MAPRRPKMAPRGLQGGSRWLHVGSKKAQAGPKTAPRGPKMAPRGLQEGPSWPQDGSKRAQDGQLGSESPPGRSRDPPGPLQGAISGPILSHKRTPGGQNRSQNYAFPVGGSEATAPRFWLPAALLRGHYVAQTPPGSDFGTKLVPKADPRRPHCRQSRSNYRHASCFLLRCYVGTAAGFAAGRWINGCNVGAHSTQPV